MDPTPRHGGRRHWRRTRRHPAATQPALTLTNPRPAGRTTPAAGGPPTGPRGQRPAAVLTLTVTPDGQGSVACPRCGPGTELHNQEIVHSTRRVIDTSPRLVIDPEVGVLWFLRVHPDPVVERPVIVRGGGDAPIVCRGRGASYQLPAVVYTEIDWDA